MYEDQYQPQQQPYYNFPPQSQVVDSDFFRYRIEGSDILDQLQHQLKNEVWVEDKEGNGQYLGPKDQEITDEGISEILGLVYSAGVNKNVILGNLSKEEIYDRCNHIWKELAKYFVLNGDRIGISRKKRSMLLKNTIFMIHSALSRSEAGFEAKQLSSQIQKIEQSIKNEDQTPQGGPFGLFRMFGGGRKR